MIIIPVKESADIWLKLPSRDATHLFTASSEGTWSALLSGIELV